MINRKVPLLIRVTYIAVVAAAIVYVLVKFANVIREAEESRAEDLPSKYSLTPADSTIIFKSYKQHLIVREVLQSKVREPVALLSYDKKYDIIMYKMNSDKDIPLPELIIPKQRRVYQSSGYAYNNVRYNGFDFKYRTGGPGPVPKIYFTFHGRAVTKVMSTDTIVSYYLECENLSIRYELARPYDIFVSGKENVIGTDSVPMAVLFLKRGRSIYFFLMTPDNNKVPMPADLLYKIVTE